MSASSSACILEKVASALPRTTSTVGLTNSLLSCITALFGGSLIRLSIRPMTALSIRARNGGISFLRRKRSKSWSREIAIWMRMGRTYRHAFSAAASLNLSPSSLLMELSAEVALELS